MAIAAELASGTFYLLMLAVGLAAAAVAAHAGLDLNLQLAVAGVVGAGAVLIGRKMRQGRPAPPQASANADVNMDIGQIVHVDNWQADGRAIVKYRGAAWNASYVHDPGDSDAPTPGSYRIVQILGSELQLHKP